MAKSTSLEASRIPVLKAHFIGRDGSEKTNVLETDAQTRKIFEQESAVEPPLDPVVLAHLFEMSGSLRTNIDAYCTNIDGFGHIFTPALDLDDDTTVDKVRQAMIEERLLGIEPTPSTPAEKAHALLKANGSPVPVQKLSPSDGADGKPTGADDQAPADFTEPSDAEVEKRMKQIELEAMRERMRLEQFFDFCCVDESFVALRMKTRQDLEVLGNAYWEVLRNQNGDVVQFTYVPGFTVRLLPQEPEPLLVEMPVRLTAITETTEQVFKRFRRFIQVVDVKTRTTTYFKEFGDPRAVSAKTGKIYKDLKQAKRAEAKDGSDFVAATEIIHFKIHNSRTPYGVPRWVSEMLSVLGARHADEINLAYFENKSIPPMAILVSGGRLKGDTVTRLENYIKNEVRGKRNFHKIMILEAESPNIAGSGSSAVKIEMKPLTDAQQKDALFLEYRKQNVLSVGSVFRLPKLLRGDSDDQNRATAQSALEFAEQQVFGPIRREFDFLINRRILTDLGVRYWKFESKGPDFSDPAELLGILNQAAEAGYATPEELREIASKGFNHEFAKIEAPWATERPMRLTLAALAGGKTPLVDADGEAQEVPDPQPPMMPGAPGMPGEAGGPPGADQAPPGKEAPPKPGEDAKDEAPPKKKPAPAKKSVPSPDDVAAAAAKLLELQDYADTLAFYESHELALAEDEDLDD